MQRTFDRSDEPLGLLALLTLIALNYFRGAESAPASSHQHMPKSAATPVAGISPATDLSSQISPSASALAPTSLSLMITAVMLAVYILCFPFIPKVFSAAIAVLSTAFVASKVMRLCRLVSGDWLLAILSLPVVASLNFFFGYPLRVCVTVVACFLLRVSGFAVDASSTELIFAGQTIEVDAPCSGIKMLWFSFYLAAAFSSFYLLPLRSTLTLLPLALAAALLGNIIRVTSLFYVETGIVSVRSFGADPHFVHEATGISAFLFQGLLIFFVAQYLSQRALQNGAVQLSGSIPVADEPGAHSGASEGVASSPVPTASASATASKLSPAQTTLHSGKSIFVIVSILCLIAAFLPIFQGTANGALHASKFPGWPQQVFGMNLKRLPDSPQDQIFLQGFPGKAARFQSDGAQIVLRWVSHESRQVHPSSDCYRGIGYDISWLPVLIDGKGNRWRHFTAKTGSEELEIKELIYDEHSRSWSDVSSWYWDANTHKTVGPWWVLTIIEPRNPRIAEP